MKSRITYDNYLNKSLRDSYTMEEFALKFSYFPIKRFVLEHAYLKRNMASLIKEHDPILYNVGKREYINNL